MFTGVMIVQPDAECRPKQRRHGHRPADQSLMPKPNQTPCVDLRALILRAAFAPISPAKVGSFFEVLFGSSLMLQGREAAQKSGFQFRHRRAHALFVLVERQEFLFHRRVQLA